MDKKTVRSIHLKNTTIKRLDKFSKTTKRTKTEIVDTSINEHIDRSKK